MMHKRAISNNLATTNPDLPSEGSSGEQTEHAEVNFGSELMNAESDEDSATVHAYDFMK